MLLGNDKGCDGAQPSEYTHGLALTGNGQYLCPNFATRGLDFCDKLCQLCDMANTTRSLRKILLPGLGGQGKFDRETRDRVVNAPVDDSRPDPNLPDDKGWIRANQKPGTWHG